MQSCLWRFGAMVQKDNTVMQQGKSAEMQQSKNAGMQERYAVQNKESFDLAKRPRAQGGYSVIWC
jgi:hypothetical protein